MTPSTPFHFASSLNLTSKISLRTTFILELKDQTSLASEASIRHALAKVDPHATFSRDPSSKNIFVHITPTHLANVKRTAQKKSTVGAFILRAIPLDSPEEARLGRIIRAETSSATDLVALHDEESQEATIGSMQQPVASGSYQRQTSSNMDEEAVATTPAPARLNDEDSVDEATNDRRASDRLAAARPNPSTDPRPTRRVRFDLRRNRRRYIEMRGDLEEETVAAPVPTIETLSLETLQMVLLRAVPNPLLSSARTYQDAVYSLGQVCRRWWRVALRTGALWSHLSNGVGPGMLEACIERSVGCMVTVHFDGSLEYPTRVEDVFGNFLNKILHCRPDWTSLNFTDLPPTLSSVITINRALSNTHALGPPPRLFSISVTTIYSATAYTMQTPCFASSSLRHLTLTGFTPDLINLSMVTNLHRLCMRRPKALSSLSLIALLVHNHNLQHLELEDVPVQFSHLVTVPETFELPELTYFKVSSLRNQTAEMSQILVRLRAPKCEAFHITIDMDNLVEFGRTFQPFQDFAETFLARFGACVARWMSGDGGKMKSDDWWLESAVEGAVAWRKPVFNWRLQGAPDAKYRKFLAQISLQSDDVYTRKLISDWAEDVTLYVEEDVVRTTLFEGFEINDPQAFESFRHDALEMRTPITGSAIAMESLSMSHSD